VTRAVLPASSAAAGTASASAIPFKQPGDAAVGGVGFPAAALVCVVLLGAAVLALRRWAPHGVGTASGGARVEVLESRRLADRMRVSVIRYRGRELLVAHSEHVATVLDDGRGERPAPTGESAA
jgi:Flagellar biosynthesis protein, FliO